MAAAAMLRRSSRLRFRRALSMNEMVWKKGEDSVCQSRHRCRWVGRFVIFLDLAATATMYHTSKSLHPQMTSLCRVIVLLVSADTAGRRRCK